jgi:hypothetical protein
VHTRLVDVDRWRRFDEIDYLLHLGKPLHRQNVHIPRVLEVLPIEDAIRGDLDPRRSESHGCGVADIHAHIGTYDAQTVEEGERAIIKKVIIAGTHLLIGCGTFGWSSEVRVVLDLDEKNGLPTLIHDDEVNNKIDCFRRIVSRWRLGSNNVVESVETIV